MMSHWSVILDIIDGGLTGDAAKVRAYAELLAERLEEDGNEREKRVAARVRRRLALDYDPGPLVHLATAERP